MDTITANRLIHENYLTCTASEFIAYFDTITEEQLVIPTYSASKYGFDVPYQGHIIENPTENPNARYYTITIDGNVVYLQPHKPFVSGFGAVTDENFTEVSEGHILVIRNEKIEELKTTKTIEHFIG